MDGIDPRYADQGNYRGDLPPDWDARRRRVYRRDDYTCQRCGHASGPHAPGEGRRLHAHHLRPRSAGGSNALDNLVTLCEPCHNAAHDHDITATMGRADTTGGTRTGRQPREPVDDDPYIVVDLFWLLLLGVGLLVGSALLPAPAIVALVVALALWGTLSAPAKGFQPEQHTLSAYLLPAALAAVPLYYGLTGTRTTLTVFLAEWVTLSLFLRTGPVAREYGLRGGPVRRGVYAATAALVGGTFAVGVTAGPVWTGVPVAATLEAALAGPTGPAVAIVVVAVLTAGYLLTGSALDAGFPPGDDTPPAGADATDTNTATDAGDDSGGSRHDDSSKPDFYRE